MQVTYKRYGGSNLLDSASFGRVEAFDGYVVVDGVQLDLRGAQTASIYYSKGEIGDGIGAAVSFAKAGGEYFCDIIDTRDGEGANWTRTVTDYPDALVGEGGQDIASVHTGSVTLTDGLRLAYQEFVDTAVKLSKRLRERALEGNHPPLLVRKAEAWIYYGAHAAAYMVGNNSQFSYAQKARWAGVGVAIMAAIIAEENSETLYGAIDPIPEPSAPMLLADPSTGARIDFADAVAISGDGYPAMPALLPDGWINELEV